jgi:hypothetical protein
MAITMKIDETSESSSGLEDDSTATSEAPPQIPLDPDDYGPFVPGLNVEDDYQRDVLQLMKDRQIEVYEYQVELWAVEFQYRSGYGLRSTTPDGKN